MVGVAEHRKNQFVVLLSGLLVAFLLALIATTFWSQHRLKASAFAQVQLGLDNRAAALSYFYAVRRDDLKALRDDRTLAVFFSNRALGMSMEYGLGTSIANLRRRFAELQQERTLGHAPVYLGLAFSEPTGALLVDTRRDGAPPLPRAFDPQDSTDEIRLFLSSLDPVSGVTLSIPVFFKGTFAGHILAWIDQDLARRELIAKNASSSVETVHLDALMDRDWFSVPLTPAPAEAKGRTDEKGSGELPAAAAVPNTDEGTVVRSSVAMTPFVLTGVVRLHGGSFLTSHAFTASLSGLALVLTVSVAGAVRVRTRNMVLNAKIEESRRQEQRLSEQNLLLASEVSRRQSSEEELRRTNERFTAVLNSMDSAVYVADLETHELLFVNQYGKERWPSARPGQKCWASLQKGQTSPCSFCTNAQLLDEQGQPTGVYQWEFKNTLTGEWYDCRDQAIYWTNQRLVRLEVATNISSRKLAEAGTAKRERYLRALADVADLVLTNGPEIPFQEFSEILGKAVDADHAFVYLTRSDEDKELMADLRAARSRTDTGFQSEPPGPSSWALRSTAPRWHDLLAAGVPVQGTLSDLPESERAILESWGNRSILMFPILIEERLRGFAGVANRLTETAWYPVEEEFLGAAAGFLSQAMANADATRAVQLRMRAEKMLAEMSSRFIDLKWDELPGAIAEMLGVVGRFADADRSYVFEFSQDGSAMSNTFEWSRDGIEPLLPELQGVPVDAFPWAMSKFRKGEAILVTKVSDMPEEAATEKEEFLREAIRSLVNVPMLAKGRLIGFVGFDAVRSLHHWGEDDIRILRVIAEILVSARERAAAEAASVRSQQNLRDVLQTIGEGILGIDQAGDCVLANPAAVGFLGYDSDQELVGKPVHALIHHSRPDGTPCPEELCPICESVRQGEAVRCDDEVFWRKDGSMFPVELHSQPVVRDGEIAGAVINFSDISERVEAHRKLAFLAGHDSLTGIPNRAMLMDRLVSGVEQAKRESSKLALLFVDLDKFKPVNDTYGHPVGDEVLRGAAQRIAKAVRRSDTVGRVGGDEFAVILDGVSRWSDAKSVAEKIERSLLEPVTVSGHHLSIGASLGIALYPDHGDSAEELLSAADAAMYKAKLERRSQADLH